MEAPTCCFSRESLPNLFFDLFVMDRVFVFELVIVNMIVFVFEAVYV